MRRETCQACGTQLVPTTGHWSICPECPTGRSFLQTSPEGRAALEAHDQLNATPQLEPQPERPQLRIVA